MFSQINARQRRLLAFRIKHIRDHLGLIRTQEEKLRQKIRQASKEYEGGAGKDYRFGFIEQERNIQRMNSGLSE